MVYWSQEISCILKNGFIAYKIRPAEDIQVGDFITGDARIYFDYNMPIITNLVSTEVVNALATIDFSTSNGLRIYPNPTSGIFNVEVQPNTVLEKILVYSLIGTELKNIGHPLQTVDLSDLGMGVYIVYLKTNKGIVQHKMVKKQ